MFYIFIFTAFTLIHLYIGRRMISHIGLTRKGKRIAWGFLGLVFALQIGGTFLYRGWKIGAIPEWLHGYLWIMYIVMGIIAFLLFFLLARDLVRLVRWLSVLLSGGLERKEPRRKAEIDPGRRMFLGGSINFAFLGVSAALTGAGIVGAIRSPRVQTVRIPISGLPKDLDGLRIVQITDLHAGPTIRRPFIVSMVDEVQRLGADMIVMTGDMADGYVAQLRPYMEPLSRLSAPLGLFWITGNHEYYWGAEAWMKEAEGLGFTVLTNEHRMVERGGGRVLIAGVTDHNGGRFIESHRSDPVAAMAGAGEAHAKILLAHQPRTCFEASGAGFDLQLSGHTHGGQFLPWNYMVRLQQPYVSGLHLHEKMWVYVSRGAGYWGPPVRLGIPSEISLIVLKGS